VLELGGGKGVVLTGGDDGTVRAWNLAGDSLKFEFRAPAGVPQGVAVLAGGHEAVFSTSSSQGPTSITLANLDNGQQRNLLTLDRPFVRVLSADTEFMYDSESKLVLANRQGSTIREFSLQSAVRWFAVSGNTKWVAAVDEGNIVYVFEVADGRQVGQTSQKFDSIERLAITNDGRSVYITESSSKLTRWDVSANQYQPLESVRGQSGAMRLSRDEHFLIVGGNHRDVSIYETASGKEIVSFPVQGADFNITNVWMADKRLIFTTDAGVLFDGIVATR
jgi:WD40 repeat protein